MFSNPTTLFDAITLTNIQALEFEEISVASIEDKITRTENELLLKAHSLSWGSEADNEIRALAQKLREKIKKMKLIGSFPEKILETATLGLKEIQAYSAHFSNSCQTFGVEKTDLQSQIQNLRFAIPSPRNLPDFSKTDCVPKGTLLDFMKFASLPQTPKESNDSFWSEKQDKIKQSVAFALRGLDGSTPFLSGQETLLESDRLIIKQVMGDTNLMSSFHRGISTGLAQACGMSETTEEACAFIGENLSHLTQDAKNLFLSVLPESSKKIFQEAFEPFVDLPARWEQKYQIPTKETSQFLKSCHLLSESFAGGVVGAGFAKGLQKTKQAWIKSQYFKEPLPATKSNFPNYLDRGDKIIDLEGSRLHVTYLQSENGSLHTYVEWLETYSNNGAAVRDTVSSLKDLAQELKAKNLYFQYENLRPDISICSSLTTQPIDEAYRILETAKKLNRIVEARFETVGMDIPPSYLRWLEQNRYPALPIYRIPLKSPHVILSKNHARVGALMPSVSDGFSGPLVSQNDQFDSALALTWGLLPIAGRIKVIKGLQKFLKNDLGGIKILPQNKPALKAKQFVKLFEKKGYQVVPGGKGSHIKMKKQGSKEHVSIPKGTANIAKGTADTLWKILKQN